MSTPTDTASKASAPTRTAENKARFIGQKDERMQPSEGYGGGVKDKTNPAPSTMPGSKQAETAKPIGKEKASKETDRG